MSRAYSLDLRERVVAAMRGGLSSYEAAAHYQVSQSSAQRWFNRALSQGSPAALPVGGRRGFLLADKLDWITRRLAEAPDTTLRGLLRELREAGVEVSKRRAEKRSAFRHLLVAWSPHPSHSLHRLFQDQDNKVISLHLQYLYIPAVSDWRRNRVP